MIKKNFLFKFSLLLSLFTISLSCLAQEKKPITFDDVFKKGTFSQKSVYGINWMKDGQFYTTKVKDSKTKNDLVIKYNIANGQAIDTLVHGGKLKINFSSYQFSSDESKVLLATEEESIYRRSTKAFYYIYDLKSGKLQKLHNDEKESFADFSPNGNKVAFVVKNNLYVNDLERNRITQVTNDGELNKIINGGTDWVYEEEFGFAKAFTWSPDGSKIAFYTFDESEVKHYNMQKWGTLYPQDYIFKYPKAGERNSDVKISVYNLEKDAITTIPVDGEDYYIPRIYWTPNSSVLSLIKLNRHQNKMEIIHADVVKNTTKVVLTEESKTYVDVEYTDDLIYLADNKTFIRTSESDGYKHIYHYSMDGKLLKQVTSGLWEVSSFLGIDEKSKILYFLSTEDSSIEKHLYSINLNGKGKKRLSERKGSISVNFSPDFKYYIQYQSSSNEPLTVSLFNGAGKKIRVIEDNKDLRERLKNFNLPSMEYTTFNSKDGTPLNAYLIKPNNFEPNKKYPVLMFVYGGPGSQRVSNSWGSSREFWMRFIAEQGYVIACVDNRGTGYKGRDFKHITYLNLGKYEVEDQIEAAKQIRQLPYVDNSRIGIWGWSYGGYMSSLALFLGNDVFKTAIAVAPVTNWRFYDTIYTERYLRTPQENSSGYDDYSPLSHTDKLKGNFLLIHGTGDDNVHFQNAVELVEALVQSNKDFESFYYPNKNHGIYGGNTTYHLYSKMTNFILNKL
jgi:dipeptidyl-peptidase 4